MEYYTKQNCRICKETMEIDAGDFLMDLDNLDNICVCDKCKENVSQEKQAKTKVQ